MKDEATENSNLTPAGANVTIKKRRFMAKNFRSLTVLAILILVTLVLLQCCTSETASIDTKTLRVIITYFRHGARTPSVATYPQDPNRNHVWIDGYGALTNVGKSQLYQFGKKYRKRYRHFIPEEYFDKDVYIRSSDRARCIMSANSFLAGLYPPNKRQTWNVNIPWQPIPVHTIPSELDNLVASDKRCKYRDELVSEIVEEVNHKTYIKSLCHYLSVHTKQPVQTIDDLGSIYSNMKPQTEAGLKLPDWARRIYPNKMGYAVAESFTILAHNETLQRLHMGPFFGEVKKHLRDRMFNKKSTRTLYLYAGHDMNVASIYRTLGFQEFLEPDYGSSITFELHELQPSDYYVKVFYWNNTEINYPAELSLPFCDSPCPYDKFEEFITHIIPMDWEAECKNTR